MNKEKIQSTIWLFIVFAGMIFLGFFPSYLQNKYEKNGGFEEVEAICTRKPLKVARQSSMRIKVDFLSKRGESVINVVVSVPHYPPYTKLKEGDIVLVRYAVANPHYCKIKGIKKK